MPLDLIVTQVWVSKVTNQLDFPFPIFKLFRSLEYNQF